MTTNGPPPAATDSRTAVDTVVTGVLSVGLLGLAVWAFRRQYARAVDAFGQAAADGTLADLFRESLRAGLFVFGGLAVVLVAVVAWGRSRERRC